MAKVTYKPGPGQNDETTQFGYEFAGGKSVDVTDQAHLRKFRGNPFFHVSGGEEHTLKDHQDAVAQEKAPPAEPERPTPAEQTSAAMSEEPARQTSQAMTLKAVHRGRGTYSVMRGDDEELREGMTKAEADEFNAMSDADKAKYVRG